MSTTWKKILKIIGETIIWIVIILMVGFSLLTAIDRFSGYNTSIGGYRIAAISSELMSKVDSSNTDVIEFGGKIKRGDCVIAKEVKSIDDLELYDVVLYTDNNNKLVCHRVVEINIEENSVVTRGDANPTVDGMVKFSSVKGVVVNTVPSVGHIVLFLQSYYGLLAICASVFFISLGVLIYKILEDKEKKKNEENQKA